MDNKQLIHRPYRGTVTSQLPVWQVFYAGDHCSHEKRKAMPPSACSSQ